MVEVIVTSNKSGRTKSRNYSAKDLLLSDEFDIVMELTKCECQPVGETNVVECNCDLEWEDYTLKVDGQYI